MLLDSLMITPGKAGGYSLLESLALLKRYFLGPRLSFAPPDLCAFCGSPCNDRCENNEMDTDDGWPQVWAEMSDEELRDRLRHYLFLAANSPLNRHLLGGSEMAIKAR